ncbi:MAG TPA: MgtC/SapB family protein [Acidimicrobiales bacterium]|nr:MgtC/SapB family protein [Acidimicrobiales bacterium]
MNDLHAVINLAVAFALTFILGFERNLRGSPAGDRTFSLVGVGTALIGVLAYRSAPNALAGAVTGVGFIGAGVVFRQNRGGEKVVHGITTAAAVFASAGIGAAAGEGRLLVALVGTAFVLFTLEARYLPVLGAVENGAFRRRFRSDSDIGNQTGT